MKKTVLLAAATAISLSLGGVASAATITAGSQLSIGGTDNFTPTSITFTPVTANIGGDTLDFAVMGTCSCCVTMIGSLSTLTVLPQQIFTATNLGNTTTMVLQVASFTFSPAGSPGHALDALDITGAGYATLTGFANTPIIWQLTTQGTAGVVSGFTFSATEIAQIPIPGALPLFASGIVGLWALGRRRKRQQVTSAIA